MPQRSGSVPSSRPSRRALLRGGAAAAAAGTALAVAAGHALAGQRGGRADGGAEAPVGTLDYPWSEWVPASPSNYTVANRPAAYPIEYVVIHVAQETFADTLAIFSDPSAEVSSHYVVASDDGRVAQCVEEKNIAWHAGNWSYNTRSVGIEHEGWVDEPRWFTDALYEGSARLTAHLCSTYGIPVTRAHIIGHNEVPGATHTDPGPLWDWDRYIALVQAADPS
ncbi:peptidoglycan recognition family protein [Streptomyces sp. RFCAC02]|uniref:N-acetylmuramoyl-L-alanine amidase n=1 Tax=Streptomyces sp. RFCAC02 TaxID=2499143 RepID=UPI00101F4204|nr:peptidoglycan recognition family protein [Streptomyces sp. RFCAC02]